MIRRTLLGLGLFFAAMLFTATSYATAPVATLTFETSTGPKAFHVEFAETQEQRRVGLMYRRSMPADHGMLFEFEKTEEVSMWMENTYISLDMVFVGPDGRVTRIAENTEPLSTRIIGSEGPAKYVVELLAGAAAKIGLKPGDKVIHPRIAS